MNLINAHHAVRKAGRTQVLRLYGKHLYPQSHLTDSSEVLWDGSSLEVSNRQEVERESEST